MTCERCGKPYRWHTPWDEPPENHYLRCDGCNRTVFMFGPDDEELTP